jgi:sporulation integral membrane protein YlbJ
VRPHPRKTFLAFGVAAFFVLMITYPAAIYRGATGGLGIWWQIVFPSLLPFFIATELLLALGVIQFLGALLEPLTQKIFRLPGTAAFALAAGYTSGYPMGAAVAARLKSQNLLSAPEAARLAAFTNNAGPLFVLVAVAVGMYQNPGLGPFLAGIHYLSNVLTGIILALFTRPSAQSGHNPWRQAVEALSRVQRSDPRNIGQLAGEAVRTAVNNLFTIGGFICLFAVLFQLFHEVPFLRAILRLTGGLLEKMGLPPALWPALGAGFFEVTLGAKTAAAANAPLFEKILVTQIILSWNGLSVVMQALSFLAAAKVPGTFFLLGRLMQALFACTLTYILFPLFAPRFYQAAAAVPAAVPSFAATVAGATALCVAANLSLAALALVVGLSFHRKGYRQRYH